MTKISLICPHCGGPFQIDDEHTLQPEWQCPYCNKQSQFKIQHGELTLQSILQEQPLKQIKSKTEQTLIQESDEPHLSNDNERIASSETIQKEIKTAEPKSTDQDGAKQDLSEDTDDAKISDLSFDSERKYHRSGKKNNAADNKRNRLKSDDSNQFDENNQEGDIHHLLARLKDAYTRQQLPLFNSLSRKILEVEPLEASVYVWRAILIEKAGGFSRHTWSDPIWLQRAPSQRKQIMRQHFYPLSTAVSLIHDEQQRQILADTISQLIADQIVQFFTEAAQLRRRRDFDGRFRKKDLICAKALKQTVIDLDSSFPDFKKMQVQNLIWHHLQHQAPQLAEQIKRYFPWP